MGYKATIRALEAAQRREQRDEQRRLRELERQAKEYAKLSAMEQARLDVERFENQLEILLSVHKERGETWDWAAIAASLPPPPPRRGSRHEQKAVRRALLMTASEKADSVTRISQARTQDNQDFEAATNAYQEEMADWELRRSLARRILAGEHKAFTEALVELNPFAELSDLGSSIHFTVHDPKLVECVLKVNGKRAIPSEAKTLTAAGKLSVKPLSKSRFQEIYQDYLCGCVIRVAREVFALFPVDTVLVTAVVDSLDQRSGNMMEMPVLSVAFPRGTFTKLDFSRLDPSDAMELFQHRGDLKLSRKNDAFQRVAPLTPVELKQAASQDIGFQDLVDQVERTREQIKLAVAKLQENPGRVGFPKDL